MQRMSWRKWLEMKNEAKPTVIDAVLGLLNFNPERQCWTHTGILNRKITESYLNFRTSLFPCEGWMRRGIIDDRKMCYKSKKIMWEDIY